MTWLYVFMVRLNVGVTENFHHDPRVDALSEKQRRAGVAQIVKRWRPESCKPAHLGQSNGNADLSLGDSRSAKLLR